MSVDIHIKGMCQPCADCVRERSGDERVLRLGLRRLRHRGRVELKAQSHILKRLS